jgi:hypothetical protein
MFITWIKRTTNAAMAEKNIHRKTLTYHIKRQILHQKHANRLGFYEGANTWIR